jgi:type IV secretory pathway TraG/TraD family ATPase VirD4
MITAASLLPFMHGAFFNDFKNGEYLGLLSRVVPADRLYLFDAFNPNSMRWLLSRDITSVEDAEAIGAHFVPSHPGEREPFFRDSAACYLRGGLIALHLTQPDFDLLDLLEPLETFDSAVALLRRAPEHNRGNLDELQRARKMNRDVARTLQNFLSQLITVARRWRTLRKGVSLNELVLRGGVLVSGHAHKFESATAAVARAVLARLTQLVLDLPNDDRPKWLFVLDELQSIAASGATGSTVSQTLNQLLSKSPGKGGVPLLGFQTVSGLREVLGAEGAAAINSYCAFKTFNAVNDPETQMYCSTHFGDLQQVVILESESHEGGQTKRSRGEHIHTVQVVPPKSFSDIKPLAPPLVNHLGAYVISPLFGSYYYDGLTLELLQRVFPHGPVQPRELRGHDLALPAPPILPAIAPSPASRELPDDGLPYE